jgi:uncharacterized protein (TIGR02757 family)
MDAAQTMRSRLPLEFTRPGLDALYARYNHKECIHPDPLEFVYRYEDPCDREVVGFIASALAYGRVAQIHRSVSGVLGEMGPSPHRFVMENTPGVFRKHLADFRHRFTTGEQLVALLAGLRRIILRHGSLEVCFTKGLQGDEWTIWEAMTRFVEELNEDAACPASMFIPSPGKGSACKRLNLFLRWMVRCDDVDPGVWSALSPSRLIVPLDTHMHRIGVTLGLTCRKQADLRAAEEITAAFRSIAPEDPVRYDFALTRLGIRGTLSGKFDEE